MESMDVMWEKIKKGLKEGAVLSMEKIEEYTKIGKLKIEELAAKRKLEKNFMDIGERLFTLIEDGKRGAAEDDLSIKKAVENVKSLKTEMVTIAEKIKAIQEDARRLRGESSPGEDDINGI
ncbi:MAG: hypothetical protein PHC61_16755 [Chitinivibrionales bacterium]|nr:hypothetical protein [Chitinivibrionales bacterium]